MTGTCRRGHARPDGRILHKWEPTTGARYRACCADTTDGEGNEYVSEYIADEIGAYLTISRLTAAGVGDD